MPAKDLDIKTIAAATAGLCLAAAAACMIQTQEAPDDLALIAPDLDLIVIEDDFEIFASADAMDPMIFAEVHDIIIEDDEGAVIADASDTMVIEDDTDEAPGSSLFAALAASVGSLDVDTRAPSSPEVAPTSTPASGRDVRLAPTARRVRSGDDSIASMDASSDASTSAKAPIAALSGFGKAELRKRAELTPEEVQTAIRRQLPKVRACYERQLKGETSLKGRMTLAMNVQPSGAVSGARVKGDEIGNDELASCVVQQLSSFRFPEGTSSLAIEYPVTFKPTF